MLDWSHLDLNAFRSALLSGHGRALLSIRQLGTALDEDAVMAACLSCGTHNWQLEGHRAEWLWTLLGEAGLRDAMLDPIFARIPYTTRVEDTDQICALALLAARAGHPQAEQHIRAALRHQPDPDQGLVAASQLVKLQGVQGLVTVAREVGQRLLDGDSRYRDGVGMWLMEAEDLLGAATVEEVLDRVGAIDERVAAVVASWQYEEEPGTDALHTDVFTAAPSPTERETLVGTVRSAALALADGRDSPVPPTVLARALARLARHGLSELDPLWVALDAHPDAEVRRQLSRLLAWHTHEGLRALALAGPLGHPDRLRLLVNNFERGDEKSIIAALDPTLEPRLRHDVGDLLLRLTTRHPTTDWSPALLHIYRHAPSSLHREDALARLVDAQQAPAWIIAEACWDAHPAVAAIAQEVMFA